MLRSDILIKLSTAILSDPGVKLVIESLVISFGFYHGAFLGVFAAGLLAGLGSYALFGRQKGHSFEPILAVVIWNILTGVFIIILALVVEVDLLIDSPDASMVSDFALLVGIGLAGGLAGALSYTVPTFVWDRSPSDAVQKRPVDFLVLENGQSEHQNISIKARSISGISPPTAHEFDLSESENPELQPGEWKFTVFHGANQHLETTVQQQIPPGDGGPYTVSIDLSSSSSIESEPPRERESKPSVEHERETFREDVQSIRSEMQDIDQLIADAELGQAQKLADEILGEISSLKEELPETGFDDMKSELAEIERECSDRVSKSGVLAQLREMDPYVFEQLVANVWEKNGWETQVTTGSNDRGVDVIATKEDQFEQRRHFIQVKRYGEDTKVGSGAIQQYAGLYARRDKDPDTVFVVTSSQFTEEAKKVAKNRNVALIDGDDLYRRLTEV